MYPNHFEVLRMKRKLFAIGALCLCISGSVIFGGCKDECAHEWENFIAIQPTCSETGLLERLCTICGEKEYEELAKTEHSFNEDNVCDICGEKNDAEVTLPENTSYGWDMEAVYDTYLHYGGSETYDDFLTNLSQGYVENIYVDFFSNLHFSLVWDEKEAPMFISLKKSDIPGLKSPTVKQIYRVYVKELMSLEEEKAYKVLSVMYTDGVTAVLGALDSAHKEKQIRSIAIDKENRFVVCYEDNTAMSVGFISTQSAPENKATLVYEQTASGYQVLGAVNPKETSVSIPLSHRGLGITHIAANAFSRMTTLQSVTIGARVESIGEYAFYNCNLSYVVIPETVKELGKGCFYTTNPNFIIYSEAEAGSYWNENWRNQKTRVYYKGEWAYDENGVPHVIMDDLLEE